MDTTKTPPSDPATLVLQNRLSHHPVHRLAVGQIVLGLVAVLSQLVISLCNDVHLHLNTLGEGLWAGLVFITVGCLGVFTSNRVSQFTGSWYQIFALLCSQLSCCSSLAACW